MSRNSIINVLLSLVALVLLFLVTAQAGFYGESLKVSNWLGISKAGEAIKDDYSRCTQNGGLVTLSFPRVCTLNGSQYNESYTVADELDYRIQVESEAAKLGSMILAPINQSSMNKSIFTTAQPGVIQHGALYTTKVDGTLARAYISHIDLTGLNTNEVGVWSDLVGGKSTDALAARLGGNTAYIAPLDATANNLSQASLIIDGVGEKVLAPYTVLVAGNVRNNYVVLSSDFTIDGFDTMVSQCVTNTVVTTAANKDTEVQNCLNQLVSSNKDIVKKATDRAQRLVQTFAF